MHRMTTLPPPTACRNAAVRLGRSSVQGVTSFSPVCVGSAWQLGALVYLQRCCVAGSLDGGALHAAHSSVAPFFYTLCYMLRNALCVRRLACTAGAAAARTGLLWCCRRPNCARARWCAGRGLGAARRVAFESHPKQRQSRLCSHNQALHCRAMVCCCSPPGLRGAAAAWRASRAIAAVIRPGA
ncbi:hypothetical protein COO60DRAFT_575786 [Scenedesmus sp. NREL 46B-D3]|nr:hypothetical protein COO60DRAFT_575786 [Scenedesmus sp. NREL 46B-D3]